MEMQMHEMEEDLGEDLGDESMPMMHMMKMYFHFGLGDLLLFQGFNLDSNLKLWLACIVLFFMSIIHEALNRARSCLATASNQPSQTAKTQVTPEEGATTEAAAAAAAATAASVNVQNGHNESNHRHHHTKIRLCGPGTCQGMGPTDLDWPKLPNLRNNSNTSRRILQALIQFLRTFLSLTIMLAAMSYNVCLIFAISLGAAAGSYIFHNGSGNIEQFEPLCH